MAPPSISEKHIMSLLWNPQQGFFIMGFCNNDLKRKVLLTLLTYYVNDDKI